MSDPGTGESFTHNVVEVDLGFDGRKMTFSSQDLAQIKDRPSNFAFRLSTGTGSGSLPGVFRHGALLPTGQLLQNPPDVPFCGELLVGSLLPNELYTNGGINYTSVSFSSSLRSSLEYASKEFNLTGWDPTRGRTEVQRIRGLEPVDDSWMQYIRDHRVAIEEMRLQAWENLDSAEREMVARPFPVLFGVADLTAQREEAAGYKIVYGADIHGECHHVGPVPIASQEGNGRLVLFCPQSKIGVLKQEIERKGIQIAIEPIEVLENFSRQVRGNTLGVVRKILEGAR